MEAVHYIWSVVSGFGILLGIFLGIWLWRWPNPSVLSNRIFSLLMAMLSLKELELLLSLYSKVPPGFEYVAQVSMLVAPALASILIRTLLFGDKVLMPSSFLFFLPALLYIVWVGLGKSPGWDYLWTIGHFVAHLLFSIWLVWYFRNRGVSQVLYQWTVLILTAIGFIGISYIIGYLYDGSLLEICYSATSAYAFLVYGVTLCVLNRRFIFSDVRPPKYKKSKMDEADKHRNFRQLSELIVDKQLFFNAGLTVEFLSKESGIAPRDISQLVNEITGSNFSDWVNGFRVEDAKRRLLDPKFRGFKISTIGFESGFNTLSSFNAIFKAKTGFTPSEFRRVNASGQS